MRQVASLQGREQDGKPFDRLGDQLPGTAADAAEVVEFKARRGKVYAAIGENGIAVLQGAAAPLGDRKG